MKENLFIRKYSFVMNGTATTPDFQEEHMCEKKKRTFVPFKEKNLLSNIQKGVWVKVAFEGFKCAFFGNKKRRCEILFLKFKLAYVLCIQFLNGL